MFSVSSQNKQQVITRPQRFGFLDALRGIAVIAVILSHLFSEIWTDGYDWYELNVFSFGKFGVATFFLVSGYIIPFSLERSQSLKVFWVGRFFRLYPLYWLSLAAFVGLYLIGYSEAVPEEFRASVFTNSLVNITMLQEFFSVPHARGHYYTLTLELLFYTVLSMLAVIQCHKKSELIAYSALGLVLMLGVLFPLSQGMRVPMAGLFYILSMFVGTVIYRWKQGEVALGRLLVLLGLSFLVTVSGIWINYGVFSKAEYPFTLQSVFLPWLLSYFVFFAALKLEDTNFQFPKLISQAGLISYSLYLLHPVTFEVVPQGWPSLLRLFISLALMFTLAYFTYNWVEKPFVSMGKKVRKNMSMSRSGELR